MLYAAMLISVALSIMVQAFWLSVVKGKPVNDVSQKELFMSMMTSFY